MTPTQRMLGAGGPGFIRRGLITLAVAAGYYVCGAIGTVLSVPPSGFAIIWPATAFLAAVLMIAPPRLGWIYVAGVVPAHLFLATHFHPSHAPLAVLLSQIGGNLALAAATAYAVSAGWRRRPPEFDTLRAVLRLIVVGAILVPAVGNALILCLHLLTGWTDTFWLSWRQFMLASIFPTLTIPPALLLIIGGEQESEDRSAALELGLACAFLFVATYVAFGWRLDSEWWPLLTLVSLPVVLWVALRLSVGATSLALVVFATAIIVRALHGQGPFAVGAATASVLSLQVFLTAFSIPLLLVSALTREHRRTEDQLKRSERRMQFVATATDTGLWYWDQTERVLWMTDSCRTLFGLEPSDSLTPEVFLEIVHPEDRPKVFASIFTSGAAEAAAEFRVAHPDGSNRWFAVRTHSEFDQGGERLLASGVFKDITERVRMQREVEALGQQILALQEQERQKIAEELHESTAQNLVAVGLSLSALQQRVTLNADTGGLMDQALASLHQAGDELRTFTYLLRPAGLEREGVRAVMARHIRGFARWSGLEVTFKLAPEADRLPFAQKQALLRILQESLTNVQRHAGATRVSIGLRPVGGAMHLVIRDNGERVRGSPYSPTPNRLGIGIPGMVARVRQLGGKIVIRSRRRGTTVHAALADTQGEPHSGAARL